jgi:glycerophosphoryl diester phosphodiesterase
MKSFALALLCSALPIHAGEPLIVAHRGASADAPENTIPAFKLAWEQGADAIEGDFHQTADGRIVCIHDKDTKRVADRNLVVKASTLAELRELDVGAYRGEEYRGSGIPTLAEVFETVPAEKKIYIEIKSDASIIPNLLAEIETSDLRDEQIVVISFREEVIHALKTQAPRLAANWLVSFKRKGFGGLQPSMKEVFATLDRIDADGLGSGKDHIGAPMIRGILDRGLGYHVWTVDDVANARKFKAWGALSITTNVPGVMRAHLGDSPAE